VHTGAPDLKEKSEKLSICLSGAVREQKKSWCAPKISNPGHDIGDQKNVQKEQKL